MSIVVWDGNALYGDIYGLSSGRSLRYSKVRKLNDVELTSRFLNFVGRSCNKLEIKTSDEKFDVVIGCTGSISNSEAFFEWVQNGIDFANWPACLKEDAECLIAFKFQEKPVLLRFSDAMYPFVVTDEIYGIGYGWPYVQGYIDAGGSIDDAIKHCAERTPFVRAGDGITTPFFDCVSLS